jgi:hypothetical protein
METAETNPPIETPVASQPILPGQTTRRRNGKIAALPAESRQFVNESLDNGQSYEQIASALEIRGCRDINKQNVGNWARGGYQEYLRDKRRNAILREQTDKVLNIAASLDDQGRAGYEKVSASLVSAKIIDALQDFDAGRLVKKMNEDPALFFRAAGVVNAQSLDFSRLRKVELDFQKYRDNVEEQKRKMEAALKPAPKAEGLTKEQIAEIHEAMRLL